ncbi:immunoglobulin lambda-1 light chain-like [Mustelus asterias]
MSVLNVGILMRIMAIFCTAGIRANFQVSQAPENTNALLGTNVTFYCTFPIFQNALNVEVYWWKLGENGFLHRSSDSRKIFLRFKQGGASFQLLNISARDAGVYYCGVKTLENRTANGTGSTIKVSVPPTPLKIFSKVHEVNSSFLDLLCETSEFYPNVLNLSWYKDGIEIRNCTVTTKSLNINGLYKVSSILKRMQPVRSTTVYTCQVSHVTLPVPAKVEFALLNPKLGAKFLFNSQVIYRSTAGAFIFLLMIAITGSSCHQNKKGVCRYVDTSELREQQMEQLTTDNKLAYASLDLSGFKQTRNPKSNEANTEHAQLSTTMPSRAIEVIYTDSRIA